MVIEVGYARAWDLEARAPWRPMSAGQARERDAAGLPYVVVHRATDRRAPLEVRLVSWRDHYVGVRAYDARGRRTHSLDLRLLDDPERLFRRRSVAWHYTGPDMAEFDTACPTTALDLSPDGWGQRTERRRGELGGTCVTSVAFGEVECWTDRPVFGGPPLLSAGASGLTGPSEAEETAEVSGKAVLEETVFEEAVVEEVTAAKPASGDGGVPAACWRVPRPAQAGPINALFRPGTRVTDGLRREMTVVEPRRLGTLRVPSGLLAVSGPDIDCATGPHLTLPVPPGEYVLDEAQARHSYHCEWEGAVVTRTATTAVRLLLSEAPASSWEMALRPGDDLRLFIDDQISGFDTDGATGCFADAGAWTPLIALFDKGLMREDPDAAEHISGSVFLLRAQDHASGGELVAFATTGDGTHPVWVGRGPAGEVVAVVVLMEGMPALLP